MNMARGSVNALDMFAGKIVCGLMHWNARPETPGHLLRFLFHDGTSTDVTFVAGSNFLNFQPADEATATTPQDQIDMWKQLQKSCRDMGIPTFIMGTLTPAPQDPFDE